MEQTWPLLGREQELRAIESTLHDPTGRGLVLSGPPGVGRSRLLRAAASAARSAGYPVELISATHAAASVPLGALAHLLPDDPAEAPRRHPFRLVAQRLRGTDANRPAMLPVDYAHALDDASAALVHHLAVHRAALVVATVREGTPAPDAVAALWKDELARRVDVRPLPDETVDELVRHAVDGEVCGPARIVLRRLAAGNPRYLREVVYSARAGGALRIEGGIWQWYGGLCGDGYLGELVAERLRGCDPAGRVVVEQVALGEPLPLALLENDPGLVEVERAGLLTVVSDGRRSIVRLAEPVHGEVLRAGLGPVRARSAYRTLAARLSATPMRRDEDLLRMATWQVAAGTPTDPVVALPAARAAVRRFDLDLAERLARAAATGPYPEGATAALLLAEILRWQGRARESLALLPDRPADADSLRVAVGRAGALYWGLGRRAEALAALRPVAVHPGTAPVRAMMLLFDGRCQEALDTARPVCEIEQLPADLRLWAHTAAVLAAANLGHSDLALRLAERGLDLAATATDQVLLGAAHLHVARTCALLLAGRLGPAWSAADEGYRRAAEVGEPGLVASWAGLRGVIGQVRGDLVAAASALREAVALGERSDPVGLCGYHLAVLAGVLAQSGELDRAGAALAAADAAAPPVHPLYLPQIELNRARLAAAAGDLTPAARGALRAAAMAAEAGQHCLEAFALYDAARYGAAGRVAGRLDELAGAIGTELVAGYADVARGLAGSWSVEDAAALEDAAARLERLDALLAAAHAAMAASRAYGRAGRHRDATRTRDLALTLDLRCRGTGAPWRAVGDATALTPREHEIALLAAGRVSSGDIALRLSLSVRTVNNHLHRAYVKLGISGRAQLAAVLRQQR